MWTQELFFAISKKRESWRRALISATVLLVLGVAQESCLVTDTIEFEDEINHPPVVVAYYPSQIILPVCHDDLKNRVFWLTLWDPDEDAPSQSESRGRLSVDLDSNPDTRNIADGKCDLPREPPGYIGGEADLPTGTYLHVRCSIDLSDRTVPEDAILSVTMEISDLGYSSLNNPREGANTVERVWVFEVEQCD